MKLYIVRHAIAVPHGTPGMADDDRELTEDGIAKMQKAAAGLRALDYLPDLILSSPLIRATQTAEILVKAFGGKIELKIVPFLAPYGTRQDLYRAIGQYEKKIDRLMIVGHQPSLGEIAGEIAFGSPEHYIELKKGGVCSIDVEVARGKPEGSLVALLTPSILRKIVL